MVQQGEDLRIMSAGTVPIIMAFRRRKKEEGIKHNSEISYYICPETHVFSGSYKEQLNACFLGKGHVMVFY